MNSDDKFWLTIIITVATTLCITILGCVYLYTSRVETMMRNGYEEVRTIGSVETIWQKVK